MTVCWFLAVGDLSQININKQNLEALEDGNQPSNRYPLDFDPQPQTVPYFDDLVLLIYG